MEISKYNGHLLCGANTVFQFTQPLKGGFRFTNSNGARLENLNIYYPVSPAAFTDRAGINIALSNNVIMQNIRVEGTGGVGIQFERCINPQASNINIAHVKKDGCGFYYCPNAQLSGLITYDTGDDALSFVNTTQRPDYNFGTATNLILRKSKARGIAILGTSDVSITNFVLDSTKAAGIYVARESIHRRPYKITISEGVVNHGGYADLGGSNPFGIHIADAGSVDIYDVRVLNSRTKGFVISSGTYSDVTDQVMVSNIQVENSGTLGFSLESAKKITLNYIYVSNSNEYGFKATGVQELCINNLTVKDVQLAPVAGSAPRAIWFENCNKFFSENLVLINTNSAAISGYLIGEVGTLTKGYIGNIQQHISSSVNPFSLTMGSNNVRSRFVNLSPSNGTLNGIVYQFDKLLKTTSGKTGQILSNSSGVPTWVNSIVIGGQLH